MTDPNLNNILRWGIENSDASRSNDTTQTDRDASRLDPAALAALLGGPSDADLMRESMATITSTDKTLDVKLVAWDNFEQLIENLDNANNMESLQLWTPLIDQLDNKEADCRRMACWCVGTAVQNNERAQERLHAYGAVSTLAKMAINDDSMGVRKKAILALSSSVRNYQPNLDVCLKALPSAVTQGKDSIEAGNMDAIDEIMQRLRDDSAKKG